MGFNSAFKGLIVVLVYIKYENKKSFGQPIPKVCRPF
jgi:hypothetical protein